MAEVKLKMVGVKLKMVGVKLKMVGIKLKMIGVKLKMGNKLQATRETSEGGWGVGGTELHIGNGGG